MSISVPDAIPRQVSSPRRRRRGITLVELIVAMVIVGATIAGLTAAIAASNRASADPLVLQQKEAIAESLMGEILLKPFNENTTPSNPAVRDSYQWVSDFDKYGVDANGNPIVGIVDVDGTPIAGLENYAVTVRVVPVALTGVPATDAVQITITVSRAGDSAADNFVLTGWRTRRS
jgi:MSHA pilin protein MshD